MASCMGFDFGYQTATFAVPQGGGIEVLLNDYSHRQTPTMAAFGDKQRYLGESAKGKSVTSFRNTVTYFKNLIGRSYESEDVQEELKGVTVEHKAMEDGTVGFVVNHNGEEVTLGCKQVVAALLGHLKSCVDASLRSKAVDCVVGIPVYFNDAQRHAMLDACKIAGLNCLRLMNEPTAVALAYGIYKQDLPAEEEAPRRVVFVDFGHGSMQLALAELVKGKLKMVATSHCRVGGRKFTLAMRDHMVQQFKEQTGLDISAKPRPLLKLEQECEKLKKQMSANSQSLPINLECLYNDRDFRSAMSRDEFEELCAPLFKQIEDTIKEFGETIQSVHQVQLSDIASVELVGGSSRVPRVKRVLQEVFGQEPSTTLNCDEAVARGCALMAAIQSPTFRVRDFKVVDATPHSITITWENTKGGEDGHSEIYTRNGAMNASKMVEFEREADFTLGAEYTSPAEVVDALKTIGSFTIQGVKPSFDGQAQAVKVKVKMDEHGCFQIPEAFLIEKLPQEPEPEAAPEAEAEPAATEPETPAAEGETAAADAAKKTEAEKEPQKKKPKTHKKVALKVQASKPYVTSETALNSLIEAELQFKLEDQREREKHEAKNALEEYIYDMRDKVASIYEEFIKPDDSEKFRSTLTNVEDWLYDEGEDQPKKVYVQKLEELQETGNAVRSRAEEYETRPGAEEALRKAIVLVRKFLAEHAAGDEKYSHISEDDVKKVSSEVEKQEAMYNEKTTEQSKLSKYETPVLTTAQLLSAKQSLERICNPIINKPKPKVEPPKEAPAEESKPTEANADAEAAGDSSSEKKEGKEPVEAMDEDMD